MIARLVLISLFLVSAPAALAGNTSSNSSSNTSSNSSAHGSSYTHTHRWSIESDNGRRRSVRGSTRIERYGPPNRQYKRWRGGDDDD